MDVLELCRQWNRDGFVLLREHLDRMRCQLLSDSVDELSRWPEAPGKWMKWYERTPHGRQLCRVEDFVPYHVGLSQLLASEPISKVLAWLLGERAVLFKEKINYKLPQGAGFAPHQDAPAFASFGQSYHVTVMLAVDFCTLDNGCLEVVEGLHGSGLFPQAADGTLHPDWVEAQVWRPIEMAPGDVLFFDSYLPHRSGPNRSSEARRALYVTYNRASAGMRRDAYFAHKRHSFPPECERMPGVDYTHGATQFNLGNPIV
mgnify:FL=1